MPTTPIHVNSREMAFKYTGTNSADILAALPWVTFVSEASGVLTLQNPSLAVHAIPTNNWFVYFPGQIQFVTTEANLFSEYVCVPSCEDIPDVSTFEADLTQAQADIQQLQEDVDAVESDVAALETSVGGLETAVTALQAETAVKAIGVAPVPLLLLGNSTTVAVQLQPAMPSSSYSAYASKFAGVSLTDLSITSVTVVDADTVNVGVSNVGLLTITGASVMVHAIA